MIGVSCGHEHEMAEASVSRDEDIQSGQSAIALLRERARTWHRTIATKNTVR
jgi:hypothetical protein